MAYVDIYDKPIKSVEYDHLDVQEKALQVTVTYLDNTVERFVEPSKEDLYRIQRQLTDQVAALAAGEVLRVVEPRVPASMDGKVWAEEFQRLVLNRYIPVDVELLTTWFANALERGRTEGQNERFGDTLGRWGDRPYILG